MADSVAVLLGAVALRDIEADPRVSGRSLAITAMVVGLAVSLFQAVTTIHEQTLAFVPKALAVVAMLLLLLPWLVRSLVEFTTAIIEKIPQMVH